MNLSANTNGFFSSNHRYYINLDVPKSSPNRKGEVYTIAPAGFDHYPSLKRVTVQFRDYQEDITAFDMDEPTGFENKDDWKSIHND